MTTVKAILAVTIEQEDGSTKSFDLCQAEADSVAGLYLALSEACQVHADDFRRDAASAMAEQLIRHLFEPDLPEGPPINGAGG